MFNDCKELFNSNWFMHLLIFYMGVLITELYNCFFTIEYTIIHVIIYTLLLLSCIVSFIYQYMKYNKDV